MNSSIDTAIINAIVAEIEARSPEKRGREVAFLCPAHNDRHPSARWSPTKHTWYCDVCSLGGGALDLARRLGIPTTKKSTVNARRSRVERGPVVAQYVYTDEHGAPLYRVDRHDPKAFLQYRALPDGSFTSGLDGVTPTIFRLPRVLAAVARADRIFIVEGEKDVLALEAAGVTATCNSGGAGKWRPEFSHDLRGADVTIVRDRDEVGHQHARDVADSLAGIATSVTIVEAATGKDASDHLAAGHSVDEFVVIEDVAAPPSLAETLDAVAAHVRRYVVLTDAQSSTIALWVAHTHAIAQFDSSPYLAITSAERQSGKTRLFEVIEKVVRDGWRVFLPSDAVLFRQLDATSPTLLLDEIDALFGRATQATEGLRGILNAANRRGVTIPRIVGEGKGMAVKEFSIFGAKALAGIGRLPDTLADRAIPIRLQRRKPTEQIEPYRFRDGKRAAEPIRRALAVHAGRHDFTTTMPEMPAGLTDRACDGWEPLLQIADAAGNGWPEKARAAALALSGACETADDTLGVRLLADIREVFERAGAARLWT
ncbi:MAG: DUF3631 domain-containing protein, partial [Chloroflexi bacterium]|nr:DUF3631 domain-containing protein [Chloroflexota bacterium]